LCMCVCVCVCVRVFAVGRAIHVSAFISYERLEAS